MTSSHLTRPRQASSEGLKNVDGKLRMPANSGNIMDAVYVKAADSTSGYCVEHQAMGYPTASEWLLAWAEGKITTKVIARKQSVESAALDFELKWQSEGEAFEGDGRFEAIRVFDAVDIESVWMEYTRQAIDENI